MSRRPLHRSSAQSGKILSRLVSLVFLGTVCCVIYFARAPLLRFAGESWIVEDQLERSDAIIILSDDNFYADRATRASQVFREGLAPLVVASGRRLRPRAGIAELMEHDLIERGVPKDKILRVPHDADNTREEAEALKQVAVERKWKSAIVVTSNYHTRRARYIFEKVFPPGTIIRVTGARDGDFDPERWWEKRISIKKFAREMAGMVVAMWELRDQHATAAVLALGGWPLESRKPVWAAQKLGGVPHPLLFKGAGFDVAVALFAVLPEYRCGADPVHLFRTATNYSTANLWDAP